MREYIFIVLILPVLHVIMLAWSDSVTCGVIVLACE